MIDKNVLKNRVAMLALPILGFWCNSSFAGVELSIVPANPTKTSEVFLKLAGNRFTVISKDQRSYVVEKEGNNITVLATLGVSLQGEVDSPTNNYLLSLGLLEAGEYVVDVTFQQLTGATPPPESLGFVVSNSSTPVPGLGGPGMVMLGVGFFLIAAGKLRKLAAPTRQASTFSEPPGSRFSSLRPCRRSKRTPQRR